MFGDSRRDRRFGKMLERLAQRPSGKVTDVFWRAAERQGAYDFLEHSHVSAEAVQWQAAAATGRQCANFAEVFVPLDGSSLALTEKQAGSKGFGRVGADANHGRGLKMLNAIALGPEGQTIGVLAQCFWARQEERVDEKEYRPLKERESWRWHEAFESAQRALAENAPQTKLHVLADQEADAAPLMLRVLEAGCDFTIRSPGTRRVRIGGKKVDVRPHLEAKRPIGTKTVKVTAKSDRAAREAKLKVRAARVTLVLRDHLTKGKSRDVELSVVWAREERPPADAEPLEWLVYTTTPVKTAAEAMAVLQRYTYRWRIEDFHRVLKSGGGCVEDSQLRSRQAMIKWATLHAMVAARAQRLRDAARATPEAPAQTELADAEIDALILLKTQSKRRTEATVTKDTLTLAKAVRYIGDVGGFAVTGVSTKMPGTTIITRGLERVLQAAEMLQLLKDAGRLR